MTLCMISTILEYVPVFMQPVSFIPTDTLISHLLLAGGAEVDRGRVAIFRQKNYSAEYETRRNRREFRRNSVYFAEEKNFGMQFRTIFWKRKTIPFRTIFGRKKTRNSIPNHFQKRKHLKIHCKPFLGTENSKKTMTFVSCFVKLYYFCGIPFDSFDEHGIPRNEHFFPRNNENCSESILRNVFGTKFRWQP